MIGKIKDISKSLDGRFRVTFEVDGIDELRGMEDKELTIRVTRKANKRSLNANAYFHVLVGKIADKLTISKAKCKNILMGRYGQFEMENGHPLIISVVSECDLLEREDIHCVPVGYGHVDGREFTHWAVIKPSHTYDTLEMSHLIDGTVEEAKELGIETLTPAELERMVSGWSQLSKKNESVTYAEQL